MSTVDNQSETSVGVLSAEPKILLDSDFRSPDFAWVHGDPKEFVDIGMSCISSEQWIGPIEDARQFAQELVADYVAWTLVIKDPSGNAVPSANDVAVGYWENTEAGLGMVGLLPLTDLYAWFRDDREEHTPSITRFPNMLLLGYDGNDNHPAELAQSFHDHVADGSIGKDDVKKMCLMLISVSPPDFVDETKGVLDELFPKWSSKKRTKAAR